MQRVTQQRKRKKKNKVVVYALRTACVLVLTGALVLMAFGCVYLYSIFFPQTVSAGAENNAKKDGKTEVEYFTEENSFSYQTGKYDDAAKLADKLIVLDAGHGGKDVGAEYKGIYEKDITLPVVLKMEEKLKAHGVGVILTRDDDEFLELEDRAWIANREHADLFFSIHCNYFDKDTSIRGLECYYQIGSESGRVLAQDIIDGVEYAGNIVVRNAKEEDFSVLRNTAMTAVLIELGYMTNSSERKLLTNEEYQDILAEDLVSCILDALE